MNLLRQAEKTKELWSYCLSRNLLPDLLNLYSKNFIFKGTLVTKATNDKYDLSKYFKKFLKEVSSVTFFKNSQIMKKNNLIIDIGKYNFKKTNGEIIKAQYVFIFDEKGKIISHYSNLL